MILIQPVMSLADVHQLHQSGSQHLTFDHDHAQVDTPVESTVRDTTNLSDLNSSFDCHHCCHCHGVASSAALPVTLTIDCDFGESILRDHYTTHFYPAVYEKQFRPPRV
jgi:hypothetical protein